MRITIGLACILFSHFITQPAMQGDEIQPPRLVRKHDQTIPPSSGPIRKLPPDKQVVDLSAVQRAENTKPAPMPEAVRIADFLAGSDLDNAAKSNDSNPQRVHITRVQHIEPAPMPVEPTLIQIEEFLDEPATAKPVSKEESVFAATVEKNIILEEREDKNWLLPILDTKSNWEPTSNDKTAQKLEYQNPQEQDAWEPSAETRTAAIYQPQPRTTYASSSQLNIAPPPPPLEESDFDSNKVYSPQTQSVIPIPENNFGSPYNAVSGSAAAYAAEPYNAGCEPCRAECETCWTEGDTWVEEGDFAQDCDCDTLLQSDLSPVIIFGAKGGNDRSIAEIQAMLPLWQSDYDLLFGDIQGRFSDSEESEGHFGIGFRTFLNADWIFGTYAYYDLRKTSQRNRFNQLTIGFEAMSEAWDFRINGYFPNEDYKDSPLSSGISNGTIVTSNFRERAYRGFNAEVGRRVLRWGRFDTNEVRWFVGYYSFDSQASGFRKIDGPRTRVEYRNYDLPFFGPQSRLTAGIEYSNDNLRDDQYWGYLRVQIPIALRPYRQPLTPLARRFMDPTVRGTD